MGCRVSGLGFKVLGFKCLDIGFRVLGSFSGSRLQSGCTWLLGLCTGLGFVFDRRGPCHEDYRVAGRGCGSC